VVWQSKADETVAFILAHIAPPPLRILDVGCGTGLVACRLQARCQVLVSKEDSFVTELALNTVPSVKYTVGAPFRCSVHGGMVSFCAALGLLLGGRK
jgi:hypothetical protein